MLLLRYSPGAERGFTPSAMRLGPALTIGLDGVPLASLASAKEPSAAILVLSVPLTGIAPPGGRPTGRWPPDMSAATR